MAEVDALAGTNVVKILSDVNPESASTLTSSQEAAMWEYVIEISNVQKAHKMVEFLTRNDDAFARSRADAHLERQYAAIHQARRRVDDPLARIRFPN